MEHGQPCPCSFTTAFRSPATRHRPTFCPSPSRFSAQRAALGSHHITSRNRFRWSVCPSCLLLVLEISMPPWIQDDKMAEISDVYKRLGNFINQHHWNHLSATDPCHFHVGTLALGYLNTSAAIFQPDMVKLNIIWMSFQVNARYSIV